MTSGATTTGAGPAPAPVVDELQLGPDPAGSPPPARGPRLAGLRAALRRLSPASLASRLVSGVVVLVVVLVLAISAATFVLLRAFLYDQLANQVNGLATRNADSFACVTPRDCKIFTPQPSTASNSTSLDSPLPEWVALYDVSAGRVIVTTQDETSPEVMQIGDGPASSLVASDQPERVTTRDGVRLMAAAAPTSNPGIVLITGLATDEVDETLGRLLLLETSIGTAAIALTLVASYAGVSIQLRGLRRVTDTAQDVTAELSPTGAGLDRRVPRDEANATEVGQLATSLNTLLGAVETQFAARVRSEERMREFLADASHELRTPLTSIRGFAELSRMQRRQAAAQAGLDPAAAAEDDALDRIESEGTRMSRLVDDLLLLARSDHGSAPARDRVEVAPMVDDVVESARVANPDRPIEAEVPAGLAVLGDRDQLLRVVRNLVTNAAVHTAPGGPILVSATPHGEEIVIQVADSGPGLEPEQAAHVFDRFWRADKARTRARGGSGLGMSIVATIVEQHQGTVRFDSSPETGSTVTVVLPAAPPA